MLRVRGIFKSYHHLKALDGLSFSVPANGITGLIGPNGAGKSTFLKILTGFETADSGEISFRGSPLYSLSAKLSVFAYMPEKLVLYPEMYVDEFIRFLSRCGYYPRNAEWTARLQLKKVFNKKIKELSKGFRQRLKLFFALASDKQFIVLDEPFDGFDPLQLRQILEIIAEEHAEGRGFLLSLHQLEISEKICRHIVLIDEGKIIHSAPIDELRKLYHKDRLEEIFLEAVE